MLFYGSKWGGWIGAEAWREPFVKIRVCLPLISIRCVLLLLYDFVDSHFITYRISKTYIFFFVDLFVDKIVIQDILHFLCVFGNCDVRGYIVSRIYLHQDLHVANRYKMHCMFCMCTLVVVFYRRKRWPM